MKIDKYTASYIPQLDEDKFAYYVDETNLNAMYEFYVSILANTT